MTDLVCYHGGNLAFDRGSDEGSSERNAKQRAIHEKASALWDAYKAGKCVLHIKRVNGDLGYFVRWKPGCKP